MTVPTKGLRLVFEEGICGLKFVSEQQPYPESNGPTDMAYINGLIEEEERRRHLEALDRYVATHAGDAIGKVMVDMHFRGTGYTRFTADGKLEHVPGEEVRETWRCPDCAAAPGWPHSPDCPSQTAAGVSLTSMVHPHAPWYRRLWMWLRPPRLSEDSLEDIEIDIPERKP